ncbi:MAG: CopD family protein [Acidobacteria bacterium]|nr:CopD family protein [Acidobacteriota bacterium]
MMGESWSLEVWAKLPGYLALLCGTGAAVALCLARCTQPGAALAPGLARLARIAGLLGVAGIVLRALAHAVAIDGPAGAVSLDTLRLVAIDSRWGGSWQWHVATAVAVALASWRAGAARGLLLYAITLAAAILVAPFLGHGAGTLWRGALHSLHLAVTGAWLGTVIVLALASGRAPSAARMDAFGAIIGRFSPWALACAAAAGVSGVALAWLYLGGVAALVETTYGRLLIAKLALVAAIGGCGFVNWQRVRARTTPRASVIQAEAVFAVLAIAVTAWLTETEHPAND